MTRTTDRRAAARTDTPPEPSHLRPGEAATILGVHPKTLKRYPYPKLRFSRTVGGHRRYERRDVLRLKEQLARHEARAQGEGHDATMGGLR